MRILERHILKSVLKIFIGCLLTFLFLYIIVDIFSRLEDILKQRVGFDVMFQYYLAYVPIIFTQVASMACLLATLYTFASLNRFNEIIAMRSSGLSILQIAKPVIVFGILISLFLFWVNDRFVPSSSATTQRILKQIDGSGKKTQDKEEQVVLGLSMYGLRNRLYYVNEFYPLTSTMVGITILEHDSHQNITKKVVANKGVYHNGLWKFYQCITYTYENGQIIKDPQYSEEEAMIITETPQDFLNQRQRPDYMNISQLDDYIWRLSESGATTAIRNLKVDYYYRFTMPLTSLVIILLAIPFSLMVKKRATGLSSLGVSIMVGFLYYVLNAIGPALGKAGILAPILAASFSHIAVCAYTLYLIDNLP